MTEPVLVGDVLPGVVAEAIARAGPGYDRWAEQVAATGYCVHPVRLRGAVEHADAATGEVRTAYSTDREPDATLLKACGNRRVSVCPSCSATYQADSFQLLAAGLRGGKGVPERVARHPRLFVTFTAPSFGPVHSRRSQGLLVYPCHPYRQGQRCLHGRRAGCWQRHDEDDPHLGEPLCPRCYQAGAQVLWNALAGRLWSRTTIYVYRALAQLAEVTEGELRTLVRVSFAKVAEYQKRGAVHFHAIIRLDSATACACQACVADRVHRRPPRGRRPASCRDCQPSLPAGR
jgi:Replication initiator protein, pSAM2